MEGRKELRCEPLADVVFNYIFSDETTTVSMLEIVNAVLVSAGDEPIEAITSMKSQYDLLGESIGSRRGRLDIRAVAKNGTIFDIEVQLSNQVFMNDRSWFYGGRLLSDAFHEGDRYEMMPRVRIINLLDFELRASSEDYLQPIGLYYKKEPFESASDAFVIYNVELPKFRKLYPTMNSVLNQPLASWLYLLDRGYQNKAEMEAFTSMTEGMMAFAKKYNRSLDDPMLRRLYEYDLSARRDDEGRIRTAELIGEARGKADGMAKGMAKGQQTIIDGTVRRALNMNMPIDVIYNIIDATREQIDAAIRKVNYDKH